MAGRLMKVAMAIMSLTAVFGTADHRPRVESNRAPLERTFGQEAPARMAFTRMREDVDRTGSDYRLEAEIWMMDVDGSHPIRLTRNTTDDLGAVWSPDGKTIAFYGVQFTPDANGALVAGPPHIFLIDVETRRQTALLTADGEPVRGRFPSWSPDGQTIAFDTGGPSSRIAVINPAGTALKQLTNEVAGRSTRPDWSPDGRKIAFARGPMGNEQIFVMNTDGSEQIRLTDASSGGNANAPDWSPDGKQIVYQSNRDSTKQERNDEIYVMNADGADQRRLTNFPGPDVDPDWSPDGRQIAFERRSDEPGGVDQVFVMSVDGARVTVLTARPSANGHPAWERRIGERKSVR